MTATALPLLVVVTGPPASGKTTLAAELARELGFPLVAKDAIKELLYDGIGTGDRAWSQRLGRATFAVMWLWLREELGAGRSLVAEANFATESVPQLVALPRHRTVQIHCDAPREVLLERYASRPRHPGHVDDVVLDELRAGLHDGRHGPLDLGGELVQLQTTSPIDVAALADAIRASSAPIA